MSTSVILERLAELLEESGKLDAAIDARLEAADLVETTLGHDDPYIAGVLSRLGDTLASGGRLDEANAAYDEAIRILSDLTGDDDLELRELVAASARIVAPRL
jgi:tetratricopeptide (TPR) repeat protein